MTLGVLPHLITVTLGPDSKDSAEVAIDGQTVGRLPTPTQDKRFTQLHRDVAHAALHVRLDWADGELAAALSVNGHPLDHPDPVEAAQARTAHPLPAYDRWFGQLDALLPGRSVLVHGAG